MRIRMNLIIFSFLLFCSGCGGDNPGQGPETKPEVSLSVNPEKLSMPGKNSTETIVVTANTSWTASSDKDWCTISPVSGYSGSTAVQVTTISNAGTATREAALSFVFGEYSKSYPVQQAASAPENYVPESYRLVWQDEFNETTRRTPDTNKWYFETGAHGWGNNELQNYIDRIEGTDTCSLVSDGSLKIIAKKKGNQVISIRMNTKESWKYGYFEARMILPSGKGTWPAFWMLPLNFKNWPEDGEIDIMEEVGYRPDWVSSSVHCNTYNHAAGTQKTGEQLVGTSRTDYHVYAVEWTEDYIHGYVDGERHFSFQNDKQGDKNSWPFNQPFYLKLNLAWGGNWGGAEGVDESVLPATYRIDYVRVYQK